MMAKRHRIVSAGKNEEKLEHLCTLGEIQNDAALLENSPTSSSKG
jgi:hypothetical protein